VAEKAVVRAAVSAAGVVTATPRRVELLLFCSLKSGQAPSHYNW
jgi:hypothetical protein